MALGLIGTAIAGGMQGFGETGAKAGLQMQKQFGEEDLQRMKAESDLKLGTTLENLRASNNVSLANTQETIRRAGRASDFSTDTSPEHVAAQSVAASGLITGTLPARVREKTELAAADTTAELNRFQTLEPVKRKALVDDAVAKLTALSTPEMLKASRAVALSTHIVDPMYTLVPGLDGTVKTFDARAGKLSGDLKGPDGKPVVIKDAQQQAAAIAVINMINKDKSIAEAAYRAELGAAKDDPTNSAQRTARAEAEWKNAQDESRRLAAPAYAVLYGKAGGEVPAAKVVAQPSIAPPSLAIEFLKKNLNTAADFDGKFGAGSSAQYLAKPATAPAPTPAVAQQSGGAGLVGVPAKPMEQVQDARKQMLDELIAKYPPVRSGPRGAQHQDSPEVKNFLSKQHEKDWTDAYHMLIGQ